MSEVDGPENRSDPIELDSKTILIQNKRFYLDVKENDRGRFLKIAEVTPGGHKNRVTMAMQLLPEFRDNLSDFIDHYISLGPPKLQDENDYDNRRPLKTARIVSGPRRYFFGFEGECKRKIFTSTCTGTTSRYAPTSYRNPRLRNS